MILCAQARDGIVLACDSRKAGTELELTEGNEKLEVNGGICVGIAGMVSAARKILAKMKGSISAQAYCASAGQSAARLINSGSLGPNPKDNLKVNIVIADSTGIYGNTHSGNFVGGQQMEALGSYGCDAPCGRFAYKLFDDTFSMEETARLFAWIIADGSKNTPVFVALPMHVIMIERRKAPRELDQKECERILADSLKRAESIKTIFGGP